MSFMCPHKKKSQELCPETGVATGEGGGSIFTTARLSKSLSEMELRKNVMYKMRI
jgi:hypothetical protein